MRKFLFLLCLITSAFFGFSQNNALVLNGAYIRLNGGTAANPVFMVVNQPQTTGIIRAGGGHIHSENQYNHVRWVASTTTGNYVFPFGVAGIAADYIPFEFNKTTAGNANLTVSTYSTNAGNLPFATPVSSMPQATRSIDRFWDIRSTAAVTANLTFRYRGIENTVTTCATDTLKAQFWNNPGGPWSAMFGPGNPGVTAGIGTVGSVPGQTYFQTTETVWALTTVTISPTISASASITCAGSNNGSATVTTSGGLGPYNYSWSPGGSTSNVATGLTPGTHTVTVTGANSCSQTRTINISQPPAITLTANQTQVTCSALASATINPAGGTPSYTAYTWSPVVSSTNTATGLSAGSYTATVTDNNGCQQSTAITITSNTATPVISASSSGILNCTTTTVQAIASTTTTPVTYTWTGSGIVSGANTASATVNASGTFNYTVTNSSNGCTTTGSQAITQNTTVPTTTASTTGNLSCSTTTVALNSTLAGMNYTWTAPAGGSVGSSNTQTTTASGVAGTYSLMVVNPANGCVFNTTTSVTQNTAVPTSTASTSGSLTCSTTTVALNSTLAGMNYTWTAPAGGIVGSANTQTTTASGAAGVYSLMVVNPANGCVFNTTTSVTQNTAAPTTTASVTGSLTCSTNTVALNSTLAGMNYTWTSPAGGSIVSANTQSTSASGSAGTYSLTVFNPTNGCVFNTTISVTQNTIAPTLTVSSNQTITCSAPTVTLIGSATPSNATPVWTGGVASGANSYSATANTAGIYTLTVTNPANGCVSSATTQVDASTGIPSVATSVTNSLSCTTLSVQVVATTTASPVSYSWTGPAIIGGANTASATVTAGGQYTVVVTNTASTCSNTLTVSVTQSTLTPTTVASSTGTLTCVTSTVDLNSTLVGMNYTWTAPAGGSVSTSSTQATIASGAPGDYTLTVSDPSNGCTYTTSANVPQNITLPTGVSAGSGQTLTCPSNSVTLTGSVSTPTNPTINWAGPNVCGTATTIVTSACTAGDYTLTVTDPLNGCSTSSVVTISPNAGSPTVTTSSSALVIDCNNATQSVTVTSTPGTDVIYNWNNTPFSASADSSVATFNTAGTYICTVTNTLSNCSTPVQVIVTSDITPPVILISGTQTLTCAPPTAVISTTAAGTYTWTGTSPIVSGQGTGSITVNAGGDYSVVVTAANGCTNTASSHIDADQNVPNVTITATSSNSMITCQNPTVTLTASVTPTATYSYTWAPSGNGGMNESVTGPGLYNVIVLDATTGCTATALQQFTVTGNTTPPTVTASNTVIPCGSPSVAISANASNVSYSWSTSNGSILSGATTSNPVVGSVGLYEVTVTDNTNGCTNTATANVNSVALTAAFSANPTSGTAPLLVNFTNQTPGAGNIYSWNFGDDNNNTSTLTNPDHIFNTTGTYTVVLLVTDASGLCSATASVTIDVFENFSIIVPNVFTPNSDGSNDLFRITATGIEELNCDIFNRWGLKLYTLKSVNDFWDGGGNSAGTYFFILTAKGYDGKEHKQEGFISLFK